MKLEITSSLLQFQVIMKQQLSKIEEILEQTEIEKVKQILSTVPQHLFQKTIQQIQQLLVSDQHIAQRSNNHQFRISLIEQVFSFSKNLNPKRFKSSNIFQLIAVCKGYFRNGQQKEKIRSQLIKNIKKQPQFWGLSKIDAFRSNLADKSSGYRPIWSVLCHNQQIAKIKYFINFYEQNTSFFPSTIEIRNYILKYILLLKTQNEQEKVLYDKLSRVFLSSPHHFQILNKNFRFCLEFLRNTYNEKQYLYYPQKNIISLLSNYKTYQIEHFIVNCSLGLTWRYEQLSSCILNCIKLGITQNTSRIIKSFIQLAKNHDKFTQIIKVFQSNIAKLFIFMKHPKLFPSSFDLLKQFILGPPPSSILYSNFIQKAVPFAKILGNEHLKQFLEFLQLVKQKYKETTMISEIQKILEQQIAKGYIKLSNEEIQKRKNIYDWKIFQKKLNHKNQLGDKNIESLGKYKGLTNIGNSCYMNSFIQCLFMTKQFRRQILKVSTLGLQKQVLNKLHKQFENDKNVQIASMARQLVRPLAQLQRLFSLLLKSQRPQISPQPLKSIGPIQFRNPFQQDSIQYGRSLLQTIHRSSFQDLFTGTLTIQIQCYECKQRRSKNEQFVDLMITYEKKEDSQENNDTNIQEMLNKSLEDEKVSNLTCDKCNQISQNSIKRHWVSKPPNYIILTIKRFQYDQKEKKNKKMQFKINIAQTFQIHEYVYQIYAIIVHRGVSANSGHYFTFGRQKISMDSQWLCFNDTQVDAMKDFERVKQFLDSCPQDTPYIIFGQRLDYVLDKQKQLEQTIILRTPLLNYVEKDNIQFLKSSQKNPFILDLKNFDFQKMFKRDDDSDQEGGMMGGKGNFPPPIV